MQNLTEKEEELLERERQIYTYVIYDKFYRLLPQIQSMRTAENKFLVSTSMGIRT